MSVRSRPRLVLPVVLLSLALTASSQESTGRKYALLIGVNEYDKNELRSLEYSENDVGDLADVLRQGATTKSP